MFSWLASHDLNQTWALVWVAREVAQDIDLVGHTEETQYD
jgi:hypothetical protein